MLISGDGDENVIVMPDVAWIRRLRLQEAGAMTAAASAGISLMDRRIASAALS